MKKIVVSISIIFITFFLFCSVNAKDTIKVNQELNDNKLHLKISSDFENPVLVTRFKFSYDEKYIQQISSQALSDFTLTKAKYYLLDTAKDNNGQVDLIEYELFLSDDIPNELTIELSEIEYSDGYKMYKLNDIKILIKGFEEKNLENKIIELKNTNISDPNVTNPKTGEYFPVVLCICLIVLVSYTNFKRKKYRKIHNI